MDVCYIESSSNKDNLRINPNVNTIPNNSSNDVILVTPKKIEIEKWMLRDNLMKNINS